MTDAPASSPLPLGSLRLGNYQPLVQLASGGMATVYVARHAGAAGFERLVVIKRVHPHLLTNREFHDMFRDEARVCSTIRHPNVIALVDVVEADNELFLVLEYVESLSLSQLITAARDVRNEPLPAAVIARILADALAGLHAAHEARDLRGTKLDVVHRDVSPQNIIVGLDGTSRLIDFGIAKAASRISVTNSGVVKGKLRYMSPEQVRQKPLDRRADIWAAGVVLFESLTGRKLFLGDDDGDIAIGILMGEIPAPSSIVTGLPPALDDVVSRALARDREERFQTALEFQEALERAIVPIAAREVGSTVEALGREVFDARRKELHDVLEGRPKDEPASASPKSVDSRRAHTPSNAPTRIEATPSRRWLVVAIVALLLVVGTGVGAMAMKKTPAPVSGDVPPPALSSVASELAPPSSTLISPPPGSAEANVAASSTASLATSASAPRTNRRPLRTVPTSDLHRKNPYGSP